MSDRDNHMRKLSFLGFNTRDAGNESPDEVKLDAEMEKVFGNQNDNKFDVAQFSEPNKSDSESYRKMSGKPSSMRRRDSKDQVTSPIESGTASPVSQSISQQQSLSDEPLVSERAGYAEHHSDSSGDAKHVQFNKSKKHVKHTFHIVEDESYDDHDDATDHPKRTQRRQHYKQRKHSMQETAGSRKTTGTDGPGRKISVQPEDASLQEADINELTSHRSDDPRGMRRLKVQPNTVPRKESQINVASPKKRFDHSPHEVFVQLDELQGAGEEREWKETARWIKYEEDVEEGSDRWGRPHVASLSFHSLLNLRRCLETGVVLMDLEERDLPGVAYRVVEQMVMEDLIQESDKPIVMRALLLRHRHVNEHSYVGFPFGTKRKFSSYTSLQNLSGEPKPKIIPATDNSSQGFDTKIDMREETYTASQEDLKKAMHDTILKRIPVGAEATTVLVGAVDFLKQPTIAFVRLAEGIPIPGVTEVPIPVRFIFILLGPKTVDLDYHEVGRSIATLMSNHHFHNIAYKADDRRDLLSAINEFLDDSIVLPPGNWQRNDLLPFDELKAKNEWIRSRKQKALEEKANKDKKPEILDEEKKLLAEAEEEAMRKKPVGPMEKTHRLWGGLINDIKRRYPMYKSDIYDGLNMETLAATAFMYFAALSTAITFGGLASDKTHNLIGISETLLSASLVGLVFHALCGQPLVIVGTTGPLLVFDEALYQFCIKNNYPFLTVRVYVGIWLAIIALAVSAFEGSVYVRLFTRFVQEIFSALITLIYLLETLFKLITVFQRHPLLAEYQYTEPLVRTTTPLPITTALIGNVSGTMTSSIFAATTTSIPDIVTSSMLAAATTSKTDIESIISLNVTETSNLLPPFDEYGEINRPNTALFCTILTLGTFAVAYFLRIFRNSHFLGRNARRALGDFGVPISIAIFVCIDYFVGVVHTDKLTVPTGISPSDASARGWIIPLTGIPVWMPFVSCVPAFLVYILVFMETHISELIVDKPERGLKKGSGLHLDIVLLCFMNTVCGFFGMPWHCAATVRSVTHVSAVTIMSRTHAPGDKPYIADVKEQRLSGFVVSLLVGLSVTAAPLLRKIPMSVLFGVFLYMGVASMIGVQFFERLRLFIVPVKYHPSDDFVKRVQTWKMHIFTSIQVLSLAALWAVKSSRFSLAFPFVLILTVPIRQKMANYYTAKELTALDGSQKVVEPSDEPDFYEQTSIPA